MATPTQNSDFFNWIADGKSCVAHHEAGHAVANWCSCLNIRHVSIMNENGYINDEHYNEAKEGANKQVISSQADSLIKISRIWADFFPANTSNQPI